MKIKRLSLVQIALSVLIVVAGALYGHIAHANPLTPCGPYPCMPMPYGLHQDTRPFEPHILADYDQTIDGNRQRMTLTDYACNGRGREAIFIDGNPKHFMKGCWSDGPQNSINIAWPNGNVAEIPYGLLKTTPYGEWVGF